MAGIFDADIQTAKELIELYGADCRWQKPAAEDGGVPGYPEPGETPDPIECRIAFFSPRDIGRGGEVFMAAMQGMEVSMSNEIGLLAGGLSFEPDDADTIIRDPQGAAQELAIKQIDRLAPNGTPILYYVTVAA